MSLKQARKGWKKMKDKERKFDKELRETFRKRQQEIDRIRQKKVKWKKPKLF